MRRIDTIIVSKRRIRGIQMDLAKLRKQRNETQKDVSEHIGISRAGYANIEERKRRPSIRVAKLIAEYFGFDWTLFFTDDK